MKKHVLFSRKAFSLLELIIVIIIVGVLASLALPRFLRLMYSAQAVEVLNQISIIRKVLYACMDQYGVDPAEPNLYAIPPYNDCYDLDKLPIDNPNNNTQQNFIYEIRGGSSSNFAPSLPFNIMGTSKKSSPVTNIINGTLLVSYPSDSGRVIIYYDSPAGYSGPLPLVCGYGIFSLLSKPDCPQYGA